MWPPIGIGLFALTLVVGGAGLSYPLLNLSLYLGAVYLVVLFSWTGGWRTLSRPAWAVSAIALSFVGLALVHLIPLPPSVWQALPGRAGVAALYAVMGWQDRWLPISVTPDLTVRFAISILSALAIFLAVQALDRRGRVQALRWIVAIALVSSLIAALQVAMGAGAPVIYDTAHRGFGVGFFVNRNHHAVLLLVALMLAAVPGVVPQLGQPTGRDAGGGTGVFTALIAIAVLALGVLSTGSRTALVALPVALLVAVALLAGRMLRKWLLMIAGGYLLLGALVMQSDLFTRVTARFAWLNADFRFQYWDNSLYALNTLFPWGSGFGSFGALYPTVEPLAQVSPLRVNHAHNDLLELALEGGLPAVALMLLALVLGAGLVWRAVRERRGGGRAQAIAASAGLCIIFGFSLVDFPLRMEAIAALFAALTAMLIRPAEPVAGTPVRPTWAMRGIILVPAIAVATLCCALQIGASLERAGQYRAAVQIAPLSVSAWEKLATQAQVAGQFEPAQAAAQRALALAPFSAAGVRVQGMTDIAVGRGPRGAALLSLGASLGWRDVVLQLWLIDAGIAAGQPEIAAERIDALLRRDVFGAALLQKLRVVLQMPGGPAAIAQRLEARPGWRQGFFNAIAKDAVAQNGSAQDIPAGRTPILALLDELDRLGQGASAPETHLIRWQLADAQAFSAVRDIWLRSGGRGLIANGEFEGIDAPLPQAAAPYVWTAPRVAGVTVAPISDGGPRGDALAVRSNGLTGGVVLAQRLVLEPGRYALHLLMNGDMDGSADQQSLFRWRVTCVQGAVVAEFMPDTQVKPMDGWRPVRGVFTVSPTCPAQQISLFLAPGVGRPQSIRIDALSLKRLHFGMAGDKPE